MNTELYTPAAQAAQVVDWAYWAGAIFIAIAGTGLAALASYFVVWSTTGIKNILWPKTKKPRRPVFIICPNTGVAITWLANQRNMLAEDTRVGIYAGTTTEAQNIFDSLSTTSIEIDERDQPSAQYGKILLKVHAAASEDELNQDHMDLCVLCVNRMCRGRVHELVGLPPTKNPELPYNYVA